MHPQMCSLASKNNSSEHYFLEKHFPDSALNWYKLILWTVVSEFQFLHHIAVDSLLDYSSC